MSFIRASLVFMTALFFGCGPAPEMPEFQSAVLELQDQRDEKGFYLLPLTAQITNENLWSGGHWPLNKGMINFRWNSPFHETFNYHSPTRVELFFMLPEQISMLSPAEKMDLLMGRYEYPLKSEVEGLNNPHAQNWEGIHNGWAKASLLHKEPKPKTLTNPDGIPVSFGSSDIKALLSYYYAYFHKGEKSERVENAALFHVMLASRIGKRNESFLLDIESDEESALYPVYGYASKVESESAPDEASAVGAARVLNMRTKISFVEPTANFWEAVRGTPNQKVFLRDYSYKLYLNLNNDIIGGDWISDERPHALVNVGAERSFPALLSGMSHLLND